LSIFTVPLLPTGELPDDVFVVAPAIAAPLPLECALP
jgi:hypothetical protein